MKESFWGYWLIVLGIFVVIVMMLISNVTTTNTQDYLLIKDVVEAAMVDAVDYSYYRQYRELRINREKFVENFLRRFSENVSLSTYRVDFYDIYEAPPKASVKITTKSATFSVMGDSTTFDIVNRVDSILESSGKAAYDSSVKRQSNITIDEPTASNVSTPQAPVTPAGTGTGVSEACSEQVTTSIDSNLVGYYAYAMAATTLTKGDLSTAAGSLGVGGRAKILGASPSNQNYWLLQNDDGTCGFAPNTYLAVNLQDYIQLGNVSFDIHNAYSNNYTVNEQLVYPGHKFYNDDYKPIAVYSFARKLRSGLQSVGMNVTIADAYRPKSVSTYTYNTLSSVLTSAQKRLMQSNGGISGYAQADFLAAGDSAHNHACAVDIDIDGAVGVVKPSSVAELTPTASLFHTSKSSGGIKIGDSARLNNVGWKNKGNAYILRYLNQTDQFASVKQLATAMLNADLDILYTEWWHYQDDACVSTVPSANFWSNVG